MGLLIETFIFCDSDVEVNIKGAAAEALNLPAAHQGVTKANGNSTAAGKAHQSEDSSQGRPGKSDVALTAAKSAPAGTDAAAAATAAAPDWSEVQELALVKALKTFGKELGQERWVRVAEAVPGKNKVECFKRFKELREGFRSKKEAS